MSDTLLVILLTAVGFLAVVLSLAASKSANSKIVRFCAFMSLIAGILCYGYGNGYREGLSFTVVIKTLLMVCRMYSGGCDFSIVKDTPWFSNGAIIAFFWVGHFMAFYITASTAIRILGKGLLKQLRMRMLRTGDLRLVYEATPDSICLAGVREKKHPIVLVSENSDVSDSALADSLGGVDFSGGIALCADKKFLKTIDMKGSRRKMDVYCIGDDPGKNLRYAETLLKALQERKVSSDSLSLTILGVPEDRASRLLAYNGSYGYGTLFAASRYDLIARLIVEKCPPWRLINCDETGRATNDFRLLMVGFGQMGQAVLRELLINSQMEGSIFHAEIFDRRMDEEKGFFETLYPALLKSYDIVLHEATSNSETFFDQMDQNPPSMIVLCSLDQVHNNQMGRILYRKYGTRPDRPHLIQCLRDSIMIDETEYRLGSVSAREMDRDAMALYHVFRGGESAEEDWKGCDSLSRASCRAAVSFFPAHLYAAGISSLDTQAEDWPPPPETLENLARTEHRRWCAFYLALGYDLMDEAELQQRCEQYRRGEIESVVNNSAKATHARLVPWEKLDDLSRRLKKATGKSVDFKDDDRKNVLVIPEIMRQISGL